MKVFYVQINYKSGTRVEAEFTEFTISPSKTSWVAYGVQKPLWLNMDAIESIWILGEREVGDVDQ